VLIIFSITNIIQSPTYIWSIIGKAREEERAFLKKKGILKAMTPTEVALIVAKQIKNSTQQPYYEEVLEPTPSKFDLSKLQEFIPAKSPIYLSEITDNITDLPSPVSQPPQSLQASDQMTKENVIKVLRKHVKGLEIREICLYILKKDPQRDKADSADIQTVKKIVYNTPGIRCLSHFDKPKFMIYYE
jgi:hypothetical protein